MLFLIQFFWQFPHFWAIGWLQFEEYKKAGFNMLPMGKKDKRAIKQIIFYTVIMILVSIAPVLKVTGAFYIYPLTAVIIVALEELCCIMALNCIKSNKYRCKTINVIKCFIHYISSNNICSR